MVETVAATPSGGLTLKRNQAARFLLLRFLLLLAGLAFLFIGPFKLFMHVSGSPSEDALSLANRPDKLRALPTATVIQAGLSAPDLPWAWLELKNRAQAGRSLAGTGISSNTLAS